jgi:CRP-like cAMP-binding protein
MLVRKIETLFTLTDAERAAVKALPSQSLVLKKNHDIVREGDRPTRSCLLISGMACWWKSGADGTRQIVGVHVPGDMPDVQSVHLPVLDASLSTLSSCEIAFIQHEALLQICEDYPRLAGVFWRSTLVDAAIFREWVMNLGARQAAGRIAHLFCEIFFRLKHVGLTEDQSFTLPMTQNELAQTTGLSTVHVNRVLQDLRAANLITFKASRLTILNWNGLVKVADFDATYLHLGTNGKDLKFEQTTTLRA